ncbi:MAG: DUF4249 domain-containing protein [Prolixibacteraceae bacterium]
MKQLMELITAGFMVLLMACTERVDIDLGMAGESKLVVFGEITNQAKAHAVYLSRSTPYFQNQPTPVVTGAAVSVSDGVKTVTLKEDPDHPGTYYTPASFAGKVGGSYQLSVRNIDVNDDGVSEAYEATTAMKKTLPLHGMAIYNSETRDGWDVAVYASEPGETKDYYLFRVYKNGILYSDTITNYRVYDDKLFNGKNIDGASVQFFDREKGETLERGDVIVLEAAGITKEYYRFIDALKEETGEKYPMFSGPPANLEGNITNGALGFFAAMEVSRASITIK